MALLAGVTNIGRLFELRAGFINDVILLIIISEPIGYKGSMFTDFARDRAGIFTKCCGDDLEKWQRFVTLSRECFDHSG